MPVEPVDTGTSFESRYYLGETSWRKRAWRNFRLLGSSAAFLWLWLTVGARWRRALHAAERDGRVISLEDLPGGMGK